MAANRVQVSSEGSLVVVWLGLARPGELLAEQLGGAAVGGGDE
jgi:hypothetical protein